MDVPPFVEEHLDRFKFLNIRDRIPMNIGVQILVCVCKHKFSFLGDKFPEVQLPGWMAIT